MSKIAVDAVLLPSVEIMADIISYIEYDKDSVIKLDTTSCLPHISLAMGIINDSDIESVGKILNQLANNHQPLDIVIEKLTTQTIMNGKEMSEVIIQDNSVLTELHLDAMEALRPFLTHDDVDVSMFYSPPAVAPVSTHWVKHYFDKKDTTDFHPHITLGEGKLLSLNKPIQFKADRLALCHLGSYCTCRKILKETRIT